MTPLAFLNLLVASAASGALPAPTLPPQLLIAQAPVLKEAPPMVPERAPPLDCTLYFAPKIKPKSPWQRPPVQIRITAVITGVGAAYGGPDSLTLSGDFSIPESWPAHLSAQLPLPKPRESTTTQNKAGKFFAPAALPADARCSATFIIIHDKAAARPLQP